MATLPSADVLRILASSTYAMHLFIEMPAAVVSVACPERAVVCRRVLHAGYCACVPDIDREVSGASNAVL